MCFDKNEEKTCGLWSKCCCICVGLNRFIKRFVNVNCDLGLYCSVNMVGKLTCACALTFCCQKHHHSIYNTSYLHCVFIEICRHCVISLFDLSLLLSQFAEWNLFWMLKSGLRHGWHDVSPFAPFQRLLHRSGTVCRSRSGRLRRCKFFSADWKPNFLPGLTIMTNNVSLHWLLLRDFTV